MSKLLYVRPTKHYHDPHFSLDGPFRVADFRSPLNGRVLQRREFAEYKVTTLVVRYYSGRWWKLVPVIDPPSDDSLPEALRGAVLDRGVLTLARIAAARNTLNPRDFYDSLKFANLSRGQIEALVAAPWYALKRVLLSRVGTVQMPVQQRQGGDTVYVQVDFSTMTWQYAGDLYWMETADEKSTRALYTIYVDDEMQGRPRWAGSVIALISRGYAAMYYNPLVRVADDPLSAAVALSVDTLAMFGVL